MKSQKITRKRRAVSPVIATVVLVAVTITVAVAVSYWMSGIASQYTSFEKVEIQTGYAKRVDTGGTPSVFLGWNVSMTLQNTGSADSTLTQVFVNEEPVDKYKPATTKLEFLVGTAGEVESDEIGVSFTVDGLTLESGQSKEFYILIGEAVGELSAGTTVNLKIHSAGGMDYIRLIKLP